MQGRTQWTRQLLPMIIGLLASVQSSRAQTPVESIPVPSPVQVPSQPPVDQGPNPLSIPQRTPTAVLNAVTYAAAGEPFGVARIEIMLPPSTYQHQLIPVLLHADPGESFIPRCVTFRRHLVRAERDALQPGQPAVGGGRLFRRVGELIRQVTAEPGESPIASREIMFLFKGNEPLTVRLNQPDAAGRSELHYNPLRRRCLCIVPPCLAGGVHSANG